MTCKGTKGAVWHCKDKFGKREIDKIKVAQNDESIGELINFNEGVKFDRQNLISTDSECSTLFVHSPFMPK